MPVVELLLDAGADEQVDAASRAEAGDLVDQRLQRRQAHASGDEQQVAVGVLGQYELAERRAETEDVPDVHLPDQNGADRASVAGLDVDLEGAVRSRRVGRRVVTPQPGSQLRLERDRLPGRVAERRLRLDLEDGAVEGWTLVRDDVRAPP